LSPTNSQPQPHYSRTLTVFITIARYFLGLVILTYGISKLDNFQIQVSAWSYDHPLVQAPGRVLAWAYLGYQPWFQFLLGVFETVPSLLLLTRRTWRLGALLLLPVMLNVVLTNYALDLWPDTKIFSCALLFINLFLVACDLPLYRSFLAMLMPPPLPFRSPRRRIAATTAAILVPVALMACFWFFALAPANRKMANNSDLIGVRQINGAGAWGVDRITIAGQDIPGEPNRRMYFDLFMKCGYKSGLTESLGTFTVTRATHAITISGVSLGSDSSPIIGTYSLQGKVLKIDGQRNGQPVEIILHRLSWGPMLPFGR
jgi:uncharacterized membrane protein YphA (DoxX/SURF4 family)